MLFLAAELIVDVAEKPLIGNKTSLKKLPDGRQ